MPYYGTHKGFAANNPLLNGIINKGEMVATTQNQDGTAKRYQDGSFTYDHAYGEYPDNPWKAPERKHGHAWMPQFGATVF